jgi:hypothetical protein
MTSKFHPVFMLHFISFMLDLRMFRFGVWRTLEGDGNHSLPGEEGPARHLLCSDCGAKEI